MYILLLTVAQAKVQELLAEQSTNNTPAGRRAQLINRGRVGQVARGGSAMESRCKESLASAGRKAGSLCASWIKYGRAVRFPPSPGALGEGRGAGFIKREGKTRTATVNKEREKNSVRMGEKWTPKVTSGTLKVFVDPTSKAALANTWRTWSYCRRLAALDASHRYI